MAAKSKAKRICLDSGGAACSDHTVNHAYLHVGRNLGLVAHPEFRYSNPKP